jgi:nucleotide-binding universal stress UspA family protein
MIDYPKYKKVLFCTDFSENADQAFDYAFGVAKRDDGILYLLHVMPGNSNENYLNLYISEKNLDKMKTNMKKDLEKLFADRYLSQIKDKSKVRVVTLSGREDEEILKFVRKEKIDLITIGTHGRMGIQHAVFGSVAEKIIRRSPVPVFIIPRRKRSNHK